MKSSGFGKWEMPMEALGRAYNLYSLMINHLSASESLLKRQLSIKFYLPVVQGVRRMSNEFVFSMEVGRPNSALRWWEHVVYLMMKG